MTAASALLVAIAAMLAAGGGALGLPEPRKPLFHAAQPDCAQRTAVSVGPPSSRMSARLMP